MIEYSKTAILTLLVITSIFLSSTLWYSTPNYAPLLLTAMNIDQTQTSSAQYQLDEVVIPREISSYKEGEPSGIVYPNMNLFDTTLERIKGTQVTNIQSIRSDSPELLKYPITWQMRFYNKMPVEYLSLLLKIDNNESSKVESSIQTMSLFYDSQAEQVRCLLEGDQLYIADAGISKERLTDIANTVANATSVTMAQTTDFTKQTIRVTELSNSLFADPTAIRQIQEKDQSIIYTDGSRGLRVNQRLNTIDYTDPTAEYRHRDVDFSVMIQEAIKFLNRHQGWVGDYVLAEITKAPADENEYSLVFQQQFQGYPIVSTDNLNISEINIKMKNNKVIRMNRSTSYLGNELAHSKVSILTYTAIKNIIERRIDISDKSYDIYLGYNPISIDASRIQLRPVWVLTQGNVTRNVFDAETGQEIRM